MEELEKMKKKERSTLKYVIFIAIPVLALLVAYGFYVNMTKADSVLIGTIETGYKSLDKIFDKIEAIQPDKITDKMKINGNIDADINLGADYSYLDLSELNFNFKANADVAANYLDMTMSLSQSNKKLIDSLQLIEKENKLYLYYIDLFSKILSMNAEDLISIPDNDLNGIEIPDEYKDIINTENFNFDMEALRTVIKKIKEYFVESIDKNYLDIEKTTIKIDGKEQNVERISYILNEENVNRTDRFMNEKALADNEFLEAFAKLTNTTVNDVKKDFEADSDTEIELESTIKLNVYTKTFGTKVVQVEMKSSEYEIVYTRADKDMLRISIDGEPLVRFDFNDVKDKIDLDYYLYLNEEVIKGKVSLKITKSSFDFYIKLSNPSYSSQSIAFDISFNYEFVDSIEQIDVSEAIDIENVTEEERSEIEENFYKIFMKFFSYDQGLNV